MSRKLQAETPWVGWTQVRAGLKGMRQFKRITEKLSSNSGRNRIYLTQPRDMSNCPNRRVVREQRLRFVPVASKGRMKIKRWKQLQMGDLERSGK